MTTQELQIKLTPGQPHESNIPGREWYPSGNADGVIFRVAKPEYIVANGDVVPKNYVKIGDAVVAMHDKTSRDLEAKAFRYIKPSSKEDRRNVFGIVHEIGVVNHLGGLVDILAKYNSCLQKERSNGFNLNCWMAHDQIGKDAMKPEIRSRLKVVPVEDGIYAVIYDPEGDIA